MPVKSHSRSLIGSNWEKVTDTDCSPHDSSSHSRGITEVQSGQINCHISSDSWLWWGNLWLCQHLQMEFCLSLRSLSRWGTSHCLHVWPFCVTWKRDTTPVLSKIPAWTARRRDTLLLIPASERLKLHPRVLQNLWGGPKIGVPSNHPFIDRILHEINHPAILVSPWLKPPNGGYHGNMMDGDTNHL